MKLFYNTETQTIHLERYDGPQVLEQDARLFYGQGRVTDCNAAFHRLADEYDFDHGALAAFYDGEDVVDMEVA